MQGTLLNHQRKFSPVRFDDKFHYDKVRSGKVQNASEDDGGDFIIPNQNNHGLQYLPQARQDVNGSQNDVCFDGNT